MHVSNFSCSPISIKPYLHACVWISWIFPVFFFFINLFLRNCDFLFKLCCTLGINKIQILTFFSDRIEDPRTSVVSKFGRLFVYFTRWSSSSNRIFDYFFLSRFFFFLLLLFYPPRQNIMTVDDIITIETRTRTIIRKHTLFNNTYTHKMCIINTRTPFTPSWRCVKRVRAIPRLIDYYRTKNVTTSLYRRAAPRRSADDSRVDGP